MSERSAGTTGRRVQRVALRGLVLFLVLFLAAVGYALRQPGDVRVGPLSLLAGVGKVSEFRVSKGDWLQTNTGLIPFDTYTVQLGPVIWSVHVCGSCGGCK